MTQPQRLVLSELNKRFGDTQVLYDVNLRIAPGEIHGLAGQNGSGKSTVIKILTGVYKPDSGASLEIDGIPMALPVRWNDVHRAGVSVVHQDLGILDQLSVAENVCVGGFPRKRWIGAIDRPERDALCAEVLKRVGATAEPRTITANLGAADRAEITIARALRDHRRGEGLIILDEATRSLSGDELGRIHDLLRRIVAEGSSVLMISHNLGELANLSDRVSVLRDGRLVASGLPASETGPGRRDNETGIGRRNRLAAGVGELPGRWRPGSTSSRPMTPSPRAVQPPPTQPPRARHTREVRAALLRSQHQLADRRRRQHEDGMSARGRFRQPAGRAVPAA